MRKLIVIIALTAVSSIGFTQVRKGTVVNRVEARKLLEKNIDFTKYKEALEKGKMTEAIKSAFTRYLRDSLGTITGVKVEGLRSMIDILPDSASKITELMTLAKHGTPEQKTKAESDLKILSEGALLIDATKENPLDAAKALEQITEMPEYSKESKKFRDVLLNQFLIGGTTVTEAVDKASNGKITLEQLRDCII